MTAPTLGRVSFESAVAECDRKVRTDPAPVHRKVRAHLVVIQGRRRWLYEIEPASRAVSA